jgi:hypothetical protein
MARKKSGGEGGNAILVVFLVLFILLSIGLGVAYWTGQEKVTAAADMDKKAKDEVKRANDEKELANLKAKYYRVFVGTASEDDRTAVQSAAQGTGPVAEALKAEHDALMQAANANVKLTVADVRKGADGNAIEKVGKAGPFNVETQELFRWDWPAGPNAVFAKQPTPGPLLDRMVRVVAERERTFYESQVQRTNADAQAAEYQKEKKSYTDALVSLNAKVQETIAKLDTTINSVETEKKTAIKTFEDKGDQAIKGIAQRQALVDEAKAMLADEQLKLKNLSNQLQTLLDKQNELDQEKRGVFAVNVPHGEIVRRNPTDKSVEINVGSDAGLRPGQTFTIQPSSARTDGLSRKKKEMVDSRGQIVVSDQITSKGSIEVVEVLGPKLSTARIVEETDDIRDSILKGDLLYNPLFRKNAKDHVVLVGIFDTNADGLDDVVEVARNLSKRGAIVDGYFDLSTRKWESLDPNNRKPGPGANTTYVVRGWEFDLNAADAALNAAKGDLNNAIRNALQDATTKGAQQVKASKFFAEIGYAFSPSISDETVNAAAVKFLKEPPAAPPK